MPPSCRLTVDMVPTLVWIVDMATMLVWTVDMAPTLVWTVDMAPTFVWTVDMAPTFVWTVDMAPTLVWLAAAMYDWTADMPPSLVRPADIVPKLVIPADTVSAMVGGSTGCSRISSLFSTKYESVLAMVGLLSRATERKGPLHNNVLGPLHPNAECRLLYVLCFIMSQFWAKVGFLQNACTTVLVNKCKCI